MFLIGLGSFCFHATLIYEAQLLDELPMFYLVVTSAYILSNREIDVDGGEVCFALAATLTGVLVLFEKDSFWGNLGRGVLTLGFTGCFIYIFYAACKMSGELKRMGIIELSEDVEGLFEISFWCFIASICFWILDIMVCDTLLSLPVYPQFHAVGWHVFSALGIWPLFLCFLVYEEAVKERRVWKVSFFGLRKLVK